MKKVVLSALIVANLAALGMLAMRKTGSNTAIAQVPARRPAEYLMIPGRVTGVSAAVVYIVDSSNQTLGAMSYDESQRQMVSMKPIDLNRIFNPGAGVNPIQGSPKNKKPY